MVHVFELHTVQTHPSEYLSENKHMIEISEEAKNSNSQRLKAIGKMLKEIRFSESRNQDEFVEWGASRRQIQRGEHGLNLRLTSLFNLLDCYGYSLQDFFEDLE